MMDIRVDNQRQLQWLCHATLSTVLESDFSIMKHENMYNKENIWNMYEQGMMFVLA